MHAVFAVVLNQTVSQGSIERPNVCDLTIQYRTVLGAVYLCVLYCCSDLSKWDPMLDDYTSPTFNRYQDGSPGSFLPSVNAPEPSV